MPSWLPCSRSNLFTTSSRRSSMHQSTFQCTRCCLIFVHPLWLGVAWRSGALAFSEKRLSCPEYIYIYTVYIVAHGLIDQSPGVFVRFTVFTAALSSVSEHCHRLVMWLKWDGGWGGGICSISPRGAGTWTLNMCPSKWTNYVHRLGVTFQVYNQESCGAEVLLNLWAVVIQVDHKAVQYGETKSA